MLSGSLQPMLPMIIRQKGTFGKFKLLQSLTILQVIDGYPRQ
jgi:hypothetical protein